MSKAARMNVIEMKPEKYEMPTTMHVNMKKFKDMENYDIGHKCQFSGTGIVRSISKRKDGDSHMEIEVTSLKKGGNYAAEEKKEKV